MIRRPGWAAALELPAYDWQSALRAATAAGDERPTWAYPWPAGERLAALLPELTTCRDHRVCDLGCGRGLLGLRAALLGAAEVVFCDGSLHPLGFLDAVIAANRLHARSQLHQWGTAIPGRPFSLILGGDILYRPECFALLLTSIARSLSPQGTALLSDPRHSLEAELPALAAAAGLSWAPTRPIAGLTVVRCRLLKAPSPELVTA